MAEQYQGQYYGAPAYLQSQQQRQVGGPASGLAWQQGLLLQEHQRQQQQLATVLGVEQACCRVLPVTPDPSLPRSFHTNGTRHP